ncbi:3-phosphoshikimate 1-carboxyvinyltransferase [Spizellomyces punctatus DAOM BR117]|uniref:Pentafunctional AROM polypeptide n=1 Tax=Spizellomyces punctatus (strain DAOM BR117) TaxID=645134 RepID=A0A0L0HRV1_SPIPD|nr:3-phosphoshikimate 1-carboxyvinyltransferase [Spizellomyces punctatus DAOM BR117]KND03822.1 3-phosphoshikimate 1-carboxyvinyltransferase [Spizellomyces punctatus DAOM BR117]|eukprot:XP_016611861.1 3-phosphoshikimate 1-carboxyvinyltransferase [Spizellomyces punctatus DAOM BR117]
MTASQEQQEGEAFTKVSILGQETIIVGMNMTNYLVNDVIATVPASSYIVVTDRNIARFHLNPLVETLNAALDAKHKGEGTRPRVLSYVMPPGESAKTREIKAQIEDWVLFNKCTRDSCFLALGGGVIGDLIGYVAATFMRGVPVIQIPTTLLAMVDSSIGGKTAVDTPHGKNLIGAFHQPKRIFIDLHYLTTLPKREFVNGLGEVIKTAAIWVEEDFDLLENYPEKILALSNGVAGDPNSEEVQLLKRVILGSARVKAHVVTEDEKEGGLRGLLNFGHSIGHAIEAILSPEMLHGECVSIGMVREAEIARHLGYLNEVAVGRLTRCLQSYGLPVSLDDRIVLQRAPHKHCPVDQLLDIMRVDKKNQGDKKRIVMLAGIGRTYEPRASVVPDDVIRKILSPAVQIAPPTSPTTVNLKVPGSKSISNRALILAALGEGTCRIHGLLHSDDVQVMLDALQKLVGITFSWENNGETLVINGGGGRLKVPSKEIYLGNAGTASRFLTTVCALIPKPGAERKGAILTGNPRMKQRPIKPLVDALRENGVDVKYLENTGSLPLEITPKGTGLPGGTIKLSASISSQYVSSILISAPYAAQPVTLDLSGDHVISQPYIDMTIAMMASFGIKVTRIPGTNTYQIPQGVYRNPQNYNVEADASSATYPLAFAAITGSTVTVTNIGSDSLQGDAHFAVKVIEAMGGTVKQTETTTTVQGPAQLRPIPQIDMESMTDAFLTASVLAAVAVDKNGSGTTQITGIANQRVKECNRIAVMVEQLAKFGVSASELPDGIEIRGVDRCQLHAPEGGVKCYDDHRVAMSFSILACAMPAEQCAIIKEKKCVEKTWPGWWDTLQNSLQVNIIGVDLEDKVEEKGHETPVPDAGAHVSSHGAQTSCDDATIVLIGMRGAGKTHAGKAAAKAFGRRFIDMDTYLEESLQTTIPKFIAEKGWEEFRRQETLYLDEALTKVPRGAVIACGGGIVETEAARATLRKWSGADGSTRKGYVVHIKRDISEVSAYLDQDKTRPMYGEDMLKVWNRRKDWYKECSAHEFTIVHPSPDPNWSDVEGDLVRFLTFITTVNGPHNSRLPGAVPPPHTSSFFLSLTYPDVSEALPVLDRISEGADALELRVDLLASQDEEYVGKQVSLLRRHSELPIVFTVRTAGQAGKFPDDDHDRRLCLLEAGVRWGCEYVDLEVDGPLERVERLVQNKGNSWIVASYHDTTGTGLWEEEGHGSSLLGNQKGQQAVAVRFRDQYAKLHPYADVIKLIGRANRLEDNFALYKFVNSVVPSLGLSPKPLIAMNMGGIGQVSRALNTFLTPVTHPLLPNAAAPGQLSISQIYQLRSLLGLVPAKKFYLFGAPISQSVSPALHNAGFNALGLPYVYELSESPDWQHVRDVVKQGVANGSFGGASVTIPLKEDVITHGIVEEMTDGAKAIGAVNTLWVGANKKIIGDNTDWLGIKASIRKRLALVNAASATRTIGVVIGAGGTARAAIYALKSLNVDEVRVWNRTTAKAAALVEEFGGAVVTSLNQLFTVADASTLFIIVGTVPSSAQSEMDLSAALASSPKGILVEMAYRPRRTPLIQNVEKLGWPVVEGVEILREQGYEQFIRWTGRRAPWRVMEEAVEKAYV